MKVAKISLKPYEVALRGASYSGDGKKKQKVDPLTAMEVYIYHPQCQHSPKDLLNVGRIMDMIEKEVDAKKYDIKIPEADYETMMGVLDRITGFTKLDREWVRRFKEATLVEVSVTENPTE